MHVRTYVTVSSLASLALLASPLSKETFKSLVKSRVTDFWEKRLRSDSSTKSSLAYFKPQYMSLKKPHPIWTSCPPNPYEINKAIIQARLVSGKNRCDWTTRHWSATNKEGFYILCPELSVPGTVEHILLTCPALEEKRILITKY